MSLDAFSDPVWDAIKAHLTANWTATPVSYPNEWYDPTEGAGAAWMRARLSRSLYGQETIGEGEQADNRWDEEGVLFLHLFAGKQIDVSKIGGAAKALADLFRGVTMLSGNLEFLDADIDDGDENKENGNWYVQTISISWRHWDA